MDIKKFFSTYTGMLLENRLYRLVLVLLLLINLALVVLMQRNQTVVLVPPDLRQEARVGLKHADRNYLEAWGLFFATLMGNVTPRNIDFIMESLERYMAPDIYQEMAKSMYDQAKSIKQGNLTLSFSAQEVAYDESTKRVKVRGQTVIRGTYGKPQGMNRTYDMAIEIRNYGPVLTDVAALDQVLPGQSPDQDPDWAKGVHEMKEAPPVE